MGIEVIEPAPDKLLTTLRQVKLTMGIALDNTDNDELLSDMIASASAFVMKYCNRDFAMQTVVESLPGKGVPRLMVSLTPIVEITSISYNGSEFDGWTILDRDSGIIHREQGFRSTEIPYAGTIDNFPSTYASPDWKVNYTGGYVLPNWGISQIYGDDRFMLPMDLSRAITDMVKSQFAKRKLDGTMKSYKIGDTSITWGSTASSSAAASSGNASALVPGSALAVLDYYRRVF